MSDNWIAIVPEDPDFIPEFESQNTALELFRMIAPESDEIEIKLSEGVQLFDCGTNLERIICPHCNREIPTDWWQDQIDEDHDGNGFLMKRYPTPCCQTAFSLNQLRYEWPQAFGRFAIDAMNPNIERLHEEQREAFERILGTPLKIVLQHV